MLTHEMTIAGLKRALPICRVNDNLYIGAFVIFGDCELTMACATELLKKAPEYDYLITAESKGIPLAYEMARQHGDKKWLLARKGAKLYMQNVVGVEVKSITTAAVQKLYLDGADAALGGGVAGQFGIRILGCTVFQHAHMVGQVMPAPRVPFGIGMDAGDRLKIRILGRKIEMQPQTRRGRL